MKKIKRLAPDPLLQKKVKRRAPYRIKEKYCEKSMWPSLPPKVRMLVILGSHGAKFKMSLIEDAQKSHPEYFEAVGNKVFLLK